jgi:hypothetical protein
MHTYGNSGYLWVVRFLVIFIFIRLFCIVFLEFSAIHLHHFCNQEVNTERYF